MVPNQSENKAVVAGPKPSDRGVSSSPVSLAAAVDDDLASGRLDLPLLPGVAQEVMAASTDDGAKKLADIVRRDQAMAAHLLRMANSPLYRGTDPIVSVQHAVSRLGTGRIRELAMMVACQGRRFEAPGFETEVRSSFQHSLATALYAQEIARAKRSNVEEAFLSGLLHDMGRPLLLQKCVDIEARLHLGASRAEMLAVVDARHTEVGAKLAAHWALPERLVATVRDHHAADGTTQDAGVYVVMLADTLAHFALEGVPDEAAVGAHVSVGALNLYPDVVSGLVARASVVKGTVEALG